MGKSLERDLNVPIRRADMGKSLERDLNVPIRRADMGEGPGRDPKSAFARPDTAPGGPEDFTKISDVKPRRLWYAYSRRNMGTLSVKEATE